MKRIFSPYRICPIGAHIDHQGGAVLGRTLAIGTTLDYEPLGSNEVHLSSERFGETRFRIGDLEHGHWARYAQAAARVLNAGRGMRAYVSGQMIGSGLSSSASVSLAFLQALAEGNGNALTVEELVQLEYELEHDQLRLQIGLLDPLTIAHGRKDALLLIDTLTASVNPIPDPPSHLFAWIVADSGVSRELTKSGFNLRVQECRQAASQLEAGAQILSEIPPQWFEERKSKLPENLRKRATHFFSEVERVHQGAKAWQAADLDLFGQLMNRSCASSINNYESGSEVLIELHEIVSTTSGIYGSRFSGGGYGGCVVGLANRDLAAAACAEIAGEISAKLPHLPSRVFIAETGDGLSRLTSHPSPPGRETRVKP
jgi:galactokinase